MGHDLHKVFSMKEAIVTKSLKKWKGKFQIVEGLVVMFQRLESISSSLPKTLFLGHPVRSGGCVNIV